MTKRKPKAWDGELHYRKDREYYRVWKSNWVGDQFEVLSAHHFQELAYVCVRFNIPLNEANEED